MLLLALRVPAHPLPPTQGLKLIVGNQTGHGGTKLMQLCICIYLSFPRGDKAGPTGATRLNLSANSDGGLEGGDPHQVTSCNLLNSKLDQIIRHRPAIDVYARTFDGFALTADTWESQRQILLDHLIGKKVASFPALLFKEQVEVVCAKTRWTIVLFCSFSPMYFQTQTKYFLSTKKFLHFLLCPPF